MLSNSGDKPYVTAIDRSGTRCLRLNTSHSFLISIQRLGFNLVNSGDMYIHQ
ncbi:hypothetical protein HanPI659440_Chr12g0467441 [Helianthus annuus]|nr:hypothetical protein HanPI659440_Chr12g0467441 [Helianthus annuus]